MRLLISSAVEAEGSGSGQRRMLAERAGSPYIRREIWEVRNLRSTMKNIPIGTGIKAVVPRGISAQKFHLPE